MLTVINSIENEVKNNDMGTFHRFTKAAGAEKIYERKEYIILRVKKDSKYKQILEEMLEAKKNKTKDKKYHNRSYCNAC